MSRLDQEDRHAGDRARALLAWLRSADANGDCDPKLEPPDCPVIFDARAALDTLRWVLDR